MTAHGLATVGESWETAAACGNGVDPDLFWPEPGEHAGLALHICWQHCPVRSQCRRHTDEHPPKHPQVLAGRRYTTTSGAASPVRPSPRRQLLTTTGCPLCGGES